MLQIQKPIFVIHLGAYPGEGAGRGGGNPNLYFVEILKTHFPFILKGEQQRLEFSPQT